MDDGSIVAVSIGSMDDPSGFRLMCLSFLELSFLCGIKFCENAVEKCV